MSNEITKQTIDARMERLARKLVRMELVAEFNKSQDAIEVQAVYKGGYADTMNNAIAASRAGQAAWRTVTTRSTVRAASASTG